MKRTALKVLVQMVQKYSLTCNNFTTLENKVQGRTAHNDLRKVCEATEHHFSYRSSIGIADGVVDFYHLLKSCIKKKFKWL